MARLVALEHPDPGCGHAAALTQQCGRCWRWCCPACYSPWMALSCSDCRAQARSGVPHVEIDLAGLELLLEDTPG
ncbi:MAG: hypothetical protein ACRD0C_17495 [Acidimicrobiia bacterium]